MERRQLRMMALPAMGAVLAGCSYSIIDDATLKNCETTSPEVLLEATVDAGQPDYDPYTDPAMLAAEQYRRAKKKQNGEGIPWYKEEIGRTVVGIGQVACVSGADGKVYLTTQGAALSEELRSQ